MTVRIKNAAEPASREDGTRVLIERYWPRGVPRDQPDIVWRRELAPSPALVAWFGRKPERWEQFKERYREELSSPEQAAGLASLWAEAERGTVTLLYGSRDRERSIARILAELVDPAGVTMHLARLPQEPPSRLARFSLEGAADSMWLAIGLFAPLLAFIGIWIVFAFQRAGLIAVASILAALCAGAWLRGILRERVTGQSMGLMAGLDGRQPIWVGLKDTAITLSGITAGVGILVLGAVLFGTLARLHLP